MIQFDLIKQSPFRIIDKALKGGLRPGETGIISGPQGSGKTPLLIQTVIDRLLQGLGAVHISFNSSSIKTKGWYENTIKEISNSWDVDLSYLNSILSKAFFWGMRSSDKDEVEITRYLTSLLQTEKILPSIIAIDDFDCNNDELYQKLKYLAQALSCELWIVTQEFPLPSDLFGNGLDQNFKIALVLEDEKITCSYANNTTELFTIKNLTINPKNLLLTKGLD